MVGVGVYAVSVSIRGCVVEVGKMIGLSRTAKGSRGGGTGFKESGVGVCAIPQIEIEAGAQADNVSDSITRIA